MKQGTFLERVAADLVARGTFSPEHAVLVVPGRRAGTFLLDALRNLWGEQPFLAPNILTLEEWMAQVSGLGKVSGLELQITLFHLAQQRGVPQTETLEVFQRWGPTLLSDLNDLDQNLAPLPAFFENLLDARRLEQWYPDGSEGRMGEAYLAFWAQLKDVSLAFRAALLEEGLAYSGLMARTLVEQPALLENWVKAQSGPVAFVGLGAMTRAELTLFQRLIAGNHVIPYWDLDRTLLKRMPEISTAFQPLLTTLGSKPLHFWSDVAESPPRVQVSGVPNAALVAQVAARWVHNNLEKGIRPEDQALVLADERYLVPVLAALPEALQAVNITMGYPLASSNWSSLLLGWTEFYAAAQPAGQDVKVYYRYVENLLMHPLNAHLLPEAETAVFLNRMASGNLAFPTFSTLVRELGEPARQWINPRGLESSGLLDLLEAILMKIKASSWAGLSPFDRESLFQMTGLVAELKSLLGPLQPSPELRTLGVFMKRYFQQAELTFRGEPTEGLQIMGLLETRALQVKHLCILPANEGLLPASGFRPTLIPFDLRKAFGLSMPQERETVFAYHFYRLLCHSEQAYLLVDTSANGKGEQSRFLDQLRWEWDEINVEDIPLAFPPQGAQKALRQVQKTPDLMEELKAMAERGFSPSALVKYLKNPYQFYRSYVLGEREGDEVEEQADARIVGEVIHKVFEGLLTPLINTPLTADILEALAVDERIPELVKSAFAALEYQDLSTGYNALLNHTIIKLVQRNLKAEAAECKKANEPRIILALEQELKAPLHGMEGVYVRGFADRIDLRGDRLVVLDYKTGFVEDKLTLNPEKLEDEVFVSDKMLQLGLYIYMASQQQAAFAWPGAHVGAGLIKVRASTDVFCPLNGTSPEAMEAFMEQIQRVVAEIMDPHQPFIEKPEKHVAPRY